MKSSELIIIAGLGYIAINSLGNKIDNTLESFTPAGVIRNAGNTYAENIRGAGEAAQTVGQAYSDVFTDFVGGFQSFSNELYSGFKRAF